MPLRNVITVLGVTAAAVLSATAVSTAASSSEDYCVVNVDSKQMSCYGSERELQSQRGASAAAVYRLGIWYDWINYNTGGGYLIFEGSHPCTATTTDTDYSDGSLVVGGWNNRVSSLTTANHCDFKLYDGVNFGPPSTPWLDSSTNLDDYGMYNKASSYRIS